MSVRGIFEILEIEPTEDTKEIKKAYAKLVKKYHPEEYPEKWKEIHDAYEAAIAWAERREPDFPAFFVADNSEKGDYTTQGTRAEKKDESKLTKENIPKPIIKSEKTEILLNRQEESGELDSLFDNIGALSREQQHQEKETFKRELQEVMNALRKISDKKELDLNEWEAFFQETKTQYMCTREFLGMLGDCFENRRIGEEMYSFLSKQLVAITEYSRDRNIALPNIGLSDPVDYVQKRIYIAYAGKKSAESRNGYSKTKRAVWVALIMVGIMVRYIGRHAGHSREIPEIRKIPDEVIEMERTMENTVENITVVSTSENDSDSTAEDSRNVFRTHVPMIPDKIQLGDSREVMIEAFGEPDEIRESQENPDYEEAVYWPIEGDVRTVIALENDIVVDIYAEFDIQ